jgi:predicted nucleotidyltransferase
MRIEKKDIIFIKKTIQIYFGNNAKVYLFGSRVDDNKKGGDIDLYIETDIKENILERKLKMLVELEKFLGEQKIDVVINNFRAGKPIYLIAKQEGIRL